MLSFSHCIFHGQCNQSIGCKISAFAYDEKLKGHDVAFWIEKNYYVLTYLLIKCLILILVIKY